MPGVGGVGRSPAAMREPCWPAEAAPDRKSTTEAENAIRALPLPWLRVAPPPRRRVVPLATAPRVRFDHAGRDAQPDPVTPALVLARLGSGRWQSQRKQEALSRRPPVRKVGGLT